MLLFVGIYHATTTNSNCCYLSIELQIKMLLIRLFATRHFMVIEFIHSIEVLKTLILVTVWVACKHNHGLLYILFNCTTVGQASDSMTALT